MTTLTYHVTPSRSWARIRREGLAPKIGPRARACGETRPAIYLFTSELAAEDAVANWLGESFGEDTVLSLIEVRLPPDARVEADPAVGYEISVLSPIAPSFLRRLRAAL